MTSLPLHTLHGHLFVELDGGLWVLDTGAPNSFGISTQLTVTGEMFRIGTNYLGLDAAALSQSVGVTCVGLLGADVLGRFDHVLDTASGRLVVSTEELSHSGNAVSLEEFMGTPIITAEVDGCECRMFFDTGARFSYFQSDALTRFPSAGSVTDFYPGFGEFQTGTHYVPATFGGETRTLRCGSLPESLGATLMMAGTVGIIGNEILGNRSIGYFPRRRMMLL